MLMATLRGGPRAELPAATNCAIMSTGRESMERRDSKSSLSWMSWASAAYRVEMTWERDLRAPTQLTSKAFLTSVTVA